MRTLFLNPLNIFKSTWLIFEVSIFTDSEVGLLLYPNASPEDEGILHCLSMRKKICEYSDILFFLMAFPWNLSASSVSFYSIKEFCLVSDIGATLNNTVFTRVISPFFSQNSEAKNRVSGMTQLKQTIGNKMVVNDVKKFIY